MAKLINFTLTCHKHCQLIEYHINAIHCISFLDNRVIWFDAKRAKGDTTKNARFERKKYWSFSDYTFS